MQENLIKEISKLELKEKDILVVRAKEELKMEQYKTIKLMLEGILKELNIKNRVIVLEAGMSFEILREAESS